MAEYDVAADDKVIVINHSIHTTDNQIASIQQDKIYSVKDLEVDVGVKCQGFERELSVSVTNLSVQKDNITYTINGSLRMVEGTDDYLNFVREINDSSYTATISQENSTETYTLKDFSTSYIKNAEHGGYSFEADMFGGTISSTTFPGQLDVSQSSSVYGQDGNDRPVGGQLDIFGQGLERVTAIFKEFTIFLSVENKGESNGNNRS